LYDSQQATRHRLLLTEGKPSRDGAAPFHDRFPSVANPGSEHRRFARRKESVMRYIATSAATVDALKKQAKKLQRKGGGKHADLLNRVAKSAGYDHWHHVTLCLREAAAQSDLASLNAECDAIIRAAREGKEKIVVTGPETLAVPMVMFASQGDAWLLDVDEGLALALLWQGEKREAAIQDGGNETEVAWDGTFALVGDAFVVDTEHAAIGKRHIHGYPMDELRKAIDKAQSFDKRFKALFGQEDAVDLTPDLIERFVAKGWDRKVLDDAVRHGARYSPSRDTIITAPIMGGFGDGDDDDDEEDDGPAGGGPSVPA
jgi:hypothetical protein